MVSTVILSSSQLEFLGIVCYKNKIAIAYAQQLSEIAVAIRDCGSNLYVGMRVVEMF